MTIRIKPGTAMINEILSPMAHLPGSRDPLAQFLSDVPDWSVLDKAALDKALQGLPIPMLGPVPPGINSGRNKGAITLTPFIHTMSYAM